MSENLQTCQWKSQGRKKLCISVCDNGKWVGFAGPLTHTGTAATSSLYQDAQWFSEAEARAAAAWFTANTPANLEFSLMDQYGDIVTYLPTNKLPGDRRKEKEI